MEAGDVKMREMGCEQEQNSDGEIDRQIERTTNASGAFVGASDHES